MATLTRKEFFAWLNDRSNMPNMSEPDYYAKSVQAYADRIGKRVEIDGETYDYFLEMMPPIYGSGCFYMCEMSIENITTKFTHEGSHYYCEYARLPRKAA